MSNIGTDQYFQIPKYKSEFCERFYNLMNLYGITRKEVCTKLTEKEYSPSGDRINRTKDIFEINQEYLKTIFKRKSTKASTLERFFEAFIECVQDKRVKLVPLAYHNELLEYLLLTTTGNLSYAILEQEFYYRGFQDTVCDVIGKFCGYDMRYIENDYIAQSIAKKTLNDYGINFTLRSLLLSEEEVVLWDIQEQKYCSNNFKDIFFNQLDIEKCYLLSANWDIFCRLLRSTDEDIFLLLSYLVKEPTDRLETAKSIICSFSAPTFENGMKYGHIRDIQYPSPFESKHSKDSLWKLLKKAFKKQDCYFNNLLMENICCYVETIAEINSHVIDFLFYFLCTDAWFDIVNSELWIYYSNRK